MSWGPRPSLRAALAHLRAFLKMYCVMKSPLKDPWTGFSSVRWVSTWGEKCYVDGHLWASLTGIDIRRGDDHRSEAPRLPPFGTNCRLLS